MIYSNERKLCLSGWLMEHHRAEYNTPLKLQKFLLFYESFSKISGESPDFSHLKGYKNGPVFSTVWGDYTKERSAFNSAATEQYAKDKSIINDMRAKKCAFLISTLTEKELSDLTHQMNLWRSKEKRIMSGELQVDLYEKDFNSEDEHFIQLLNDMYPEKIVNNSTIINLDKNYFIFQNKEIEKLTEEHFDILLTLAGQENLQNPVYVDIDETGRLLID